MESDGEQFWVTCDVGENDVIRTYPVAFSEVPGMAMLPSLNLPWPGQSKDEIEARPMMTLNGDGNLRPYGFGYGDYGFDENQNESDSAYMRSAILQYIEEALAESVAQMSAYGIVGLIRGIRFPIANGYMTLQQLVSEGIVIGTILVGTQRFSVKVIITSPPSVRVAN